MSTNWKAGSWPASVLRLRLRIVSKTVAVLPVPGTPDTYKHRPPLLPACKAKSALRTCMLATHMVLHCGLACAWLVLSDARSRATSVYIAPTAARLPQLVDTLDVHRHALLPLIERIAGSGERL